MIVGINCGHTVSGTVGSGAVGFLNESNETRRVGYKVMEYLRAKGVTVVDCTDDYSSTVSGNLKKIVDKANAQPLDLFVSIHFNSGGGRGTEVYTYNGEVFKQAELVCENMAELGFINRGIKIIWLWNLAGGQGEEKYIKELGISGFTVPFFKEYMNKINVKLK